MARRVPIRFLHRSILAVSLATPLTLSGCDGGDEEGPQDDSTQGVDSTGGDASEPGEGAMSETGHDEHGGTHDHEDDGDTPGEGASDASDDAPDPESDDSGTSGSAGSSGDAGGLEGFCDDEDRATPYEPGMREDGRDELVSIVLLESDPAPPIKGDNRWTVRIEDAGGTPLSGLDVSVMPFMPDHGHGTPISASVTELGEGRYQLDPVNLFMRGYWRVRIDASSSDLGSDYAIFHICVE